MNAPRYDQEHMDVRFPAAPVEPGPFAGNTLDRLDGHRRDKSWLKNAISSKAARFVILKEGDVLIRIKPARKPLYLKRPDVSKFLKAGLDTVLLGGDGKIVYFALDLAGATKKEVNKLTSKNCQFKDLRSTAFALAATNFQPDLAILGLAKALAGWHRAHGFCARCGSGTKMLQAGYMRRCLNKACEADHFPRTDPVVIMLATRGGKCLLGRQSHFPEGVYSALAGFMEPGESIEEAVRRELYEEAGIRAGEVRYFASQPWPFPSSLMIGCYAEALNSDLEKRDGELEDVRWVDMDDVRKALEGHARSAIKLAPPMAIAHRLIRSWMLFAHE